MKDRLTILCGDCREVLKTLPDKSVQCCVTSPPYWGLRDYGHADQIGLEESPQAFVDTMRQVFAEVWRVLRDDGTLWLNLGDSYNSNQAGKTAGGFQGHQAKDGIAQAFETGQRVNGTGKTKYPGGKPKDLIGIPWRVALALQADGWWLRSDIIWHKRSCMPESVTDRCTRSHEYLFMLAKAEKYFFDAEAIAEPVSEVYAKDNRPDGVLRQRLYEGSKYRESGMVEPLNGKPDDYEARRMTRNKRTVWEPKREPYPDAHFATFPPDLIKPCILAGTSANGCCSKCGAPWERVTVRHDQGWDGSRYGERAVAATGGATSGGTACSTLGSPNGRLTGKTETTGWRATCDHDAPAIPCTVLDPFFGSGTTGMVAIDLGRRCIGIELNEEYVKLARQRCDVTPGLALA